MKSIKRRPYPRNFLTPAQIETILRLRERGWSHQRLADRYDRSTARINQILNPPRNKRAA
jgi:transcriptional regulator